jgi:hypothetical protein
MPLIYFSQTREEKKIQAFVKMFEKMEKADTIRKETKKAMKQSVKRITQIEAFEREQCLSVPSSLKSGGSSCKTTDEGSNYLDDIRDFTSSSVKSILRKTEGDLTACCAPRESQPSHKILNGDLHAWQDGGKLPINRSEVAAYEKDCNVEKLSSEAGPENALMKQTDVSNLVETEELDVTENEKFEKNVYLADDSVKTRGMDISTENRSTAKMCLRSSSLVKTTLRTAGARKIRSNTVPERKRVGSIEKTEGHDNLNYSDNVVNLQQATAARKIDTDSVKDNSGSLRVSSSGVNVKMKESQIIIPYPSYTDISEHERRTAESNCADVKQCYSRTRNASTLCITFKINCLVATCVCVNSFLLMTVNTM